MEQLPDLLQFWTLQSEAVKGARSRRQAVSDRLANTGAVSRTRHGYPGVRPLHRFS